MKDGIKSTIKHELILAYACGLRPKDIMLRGYKEWTAYAYFRHFKKAQEIFRKTWGVKINGR